MCFFLYVKVVPTQMSRMFFVFEFFFFFHFIDFGGRGGGVWHVFQISVWPRSCAWSAVSCRVLTSHFNCMAAKLGLKALTTYPGIF